jgi:hypothetical protein
VGQQGYIIFGNSSKIKVTNYTSITIPFFRKLPLRMMLNLRKRRRWWKKQSDSTPYMLSSVIKTMSNNLSDDL